MDRNLGVRDLTFMGVAAIIGASIFSAIGQASANGGPAVSMLFVFTAMACMFTAFCYARFAATVPISGSAYTYAYTSLGEIVAWILGWNLLLEYAISNVAVAISWSKYFVDLLEGLNITDETYVHIASSLKDTKKPIIFVLEGGYNIQVIHSVISKMIQVFE